MRVAFVLVIFLAAIAVAQTPPVPPPASATPAAAPEKPAPPETPLSKAEKDLRTGNYAEVIKATDSLDSEDWPVLRIKAQLATGKYADAKTALEKALGEFPNSLPLRLVGMEVLQMNNDAPRAREMRDEMDRLASRSWAFHSAADYVAMARARIILGSDPKAVLEKILDPVKKEAPEYRDTYLATGDLALSKSDFALAGRSFALAAKKFPDEPEAFFGMARAFESSDSKVTSEALEKTLTLNPNHVGARLMLAENQIHSEAFPEAEAVLAKALEVNPNDPKIHALRAVIAHLRNDSKAEADERAAALKPWPENPAVPHLIGTRLSAKYRFAEAAELQRQALKWDPEFLPAKSALAQDLLRLGDDSGWALAEEVQKADPYDVIAYNLMQLRDAMAKFRTLKSEHFNVKMEPHEADVYGSMVIELLEHAYAALVKKYGVKLDGRTTVEIFNDQKDFAIRTFGLPGGAGYLGVCFGRVITANSPAARPGSTSNWQSMLWHEFGHVVTLTLTRNKMPRWFSEGISVYEERQHGGPWGEQMSPRYRRMILGDDLTPLSKMGKAFQSPKSPAHLQFAYYEASLVIEWLVQKWGVEKLRACLADLGRGTAMNAALTSNFEPVAQLDAGFAEFIKARAKATGPKLDWKEPERGEIASPQKLDEWIAKNPDNYTALSDQASKHLHAREWEAAKKPLRRLIELYPEQHEADSAYAQLAQVHHELSEFADEEAMLKKVAELCADARDAYERLMEIAAARKDWNSVLEWSQRFAAVNPLLPASHSRAAEARVALGDKPGAIASYRTLLALDPPDPAGVHFSLAKLLTSTDAPDAKRHVLLALEEAPRFRAALDLLLEMNAKAAPKPFPKKP